MEEHRLALILISTFNGEKYLATQLDSIIAQTMTHWTLLIRDDGSSDSTLHIIKKYCQLDSRIIFIQDNLGNLQVPKNYSTLMQHALERPEKYIFFCDQDDVWLREKLLLQLNALHRMEQQFGKNIPLLIHSDLCVVDNDLNTIHPSYLEFEKIKRNTQLPLTTLLINNFISGCTLGMNKRLLRIAFPIPENVLLHDWWCALCAASIGKIDFVDQATLLYRQHEHNSIGSNGFYKKLININSGTFTKKKINFKHCFAQAENLLSRIKPEQANYQVINDFSGLLNKNVLSRYVNARKLKLKASHVLRGVMFWFMLGLV